MSNDVEKYPCIVAGCKNTVFFSERDKEFYISKGFVGTDGSVTKPKKCKQHRLERKQQAQMNENKVPYK